MPYLWTARLRQDFHQALETLHAETKTPSLEVSYNEIGTGSKNYTLRMRDELQLVNHIAFLAHSQEGVEAISGACVEEVRDGLTIRLASNHTPSPDTVSKLQNILSITSRGATQGTSREILRERIFLDVLNLSQERILQRIRPHWVPAPSYFRGTEEPLLNRITRFYPLSESSSGLTRCLVSRLDKLLSSLRLLETPERPDKEVIQAAITNVVRCCADLSYSGELRSLEQQLRQIPGCHRISESREVAQIDKLARYFGLSDDLAKLARRSEYRYVTQNLALQYLTAYPTSKPAGALRTCHVHAEVQLILYYTQYSLEKPPRSIGCSKSACFLCDSLIQMLGQYHISYAHRRLYNQWTIPDVPWMPAEKVYHFRSILENMIIAMVSLTGDLRRTTANSRRQGLRPFGLESRACLPLSSNSDFSVPAVPSGLAGPLPASYALSSLSLQTKEDVAAVASLHSLDISSNFSLSSVDLTHEDLPHHQPLSPKTGTLFLRLDGVLIIFDCSSVSTGRLSICEIDGACRKEKGWQCILVSDITTTGMTLHDTTSPLALMFQLQVSRRMTIEIEICWESQSGDLCIS